MTSIISGRWVLSNTLASLTLTSSFDVRLALCKSSVSECWFFIGVECFSESLKIFFRIFKFGVICGLVVVIDITDFGVCGL